MASTPRKRMPAKGRQAARSSILGQLKPEEASRVLRSVLLRHPELEAEAAELAESLLTTIDAEALAEELAESVLAVDHAEMDCRSGRQPWGYVDPTDAAWEALEEAVEPFIADMKRLLDLGSEAAAIAACRGIVLGLYSLRHTKPGDVLEWAPDFPLEAAANAVSELVAAANAESPRRAATTALGNEAADWADVLSRAARGRR